MTAFQAIKQPCGFLFRPGLCGRRHLAARQPRSNRNAPDASARWIAGRTAHHVSTRRPSASNPTSEAISLKTKSGRGTDGCSSTPRRLIQAMVRPSGLPPTRSVNCDLGRSEESRLSRRPRWRAGSETGCRPACSPRARSSGADEIEVAPELRHSEADRRRCWRRARGGSLRLNVSSVEETVRVELEARIGLEIALNQPGAALQAKVRQCFGQRLLSQIFLLVVGTIGLAIVRDVARFPGNPRTPSRRRRMPPHSRRIDAKAG